MKEFGSEKNNFWQNDSCENLDNFSSAFDGAIWYFPYTM